MIEANVFVSFKDRSDIPPIKLPSLVTAESLLDVVYHKPGFGEGTVEDEEGTTIVMHRCAQVFDTRL